MDVVSNMAMGENENDNETKPKPANPLGVGIISKSFLKVIYILKLHLI